MTVLLTLTLTLTPTLPLALALPLPLPLELARTVPSAAAETKCARRSCLAGDRGRCREIQGDIGRYREIGEIEGGIGR